MRASNHSSGDGFLYGSTASLTNPQLWLMYARSWNHGTHILKTLHHHSDFKLTHCETMTALLASPYEQLFLDSRSLQNNINGSRNGPFCLGCDQNTVSPFHKLFIVNDGGLH